VPIVFFRDDVFEVKRKGFVVLMNAAIFAAAASPLSDPASRGSIDHDSFAKIRRACACRMAIRLPAVT
jgi:hypothetical protein